MTEGTARRKGLSNPKTYCIGTALKTFTRFRTMQDDVISCDWIRGVRCDRNAAREARTHARRFLHLHCVKREPFYESGDCRGGWRRFRGGRPGVAGGKRRGPRRVGAGYGKDFFLVGSVFGGHERAHH